MTTDLAIRNQVSTVELAHSLADSTLLPASYRRQPANLIFAFEYADTLGIPRINALTSIHVIDGKPTASADLIAALVRRAGHRLRVEGDDTFAEAVIIRADDPTYEPKPIRWDMARARAAGLAGKNVWKAYPAAMLRSRAITEAARMWASDALYGVIYTPEELGAEMTVDGEVVDTPAPASQPRQQPPTTTQPAPDPEPGAKPLTSEEADSFVATIGETTNTEDLAAIWEVLRQTVPGEHGERIRVAYAERLGQIERGEVGQSAPEPEQTAIDDQPLDVDTEAVPQ